MQNYLKKAVQRISCVFKNNFWFQFWSSFNNCICTPWQCPKLNGEIWDADLSFWLRNNLHCFFFIVFFVRPDIHSSHIRNTKKAIYPLLSASSKLYWDGIYDALTNSYRKSYPYRYMNSPLTSIVKLKSSEKKSKKNEFFRVFQIGLSFKLSGPIFIYLSIYLFINFIWCWKDTNGNVITNQNWL